MTPSSTTCFRLAALRRCRRNGNDYNTYELDVSPAVTGLTNVVGTGALLTTFTISTRSLRRRPRNNGPTQHLTFAIDDVATIKVPGGGTVTFKSFDSNCVQVENCGPQGAPPARLPHRSHLSGAVPAAPSSFAPAVAHLDRLRTVGVLRHQERDRLAMIGKDFVRAPPD